MCLPDDGQDGAYCSSRLDGQEPRGQGDIAHELPAPSQASLLHESFFQQLRSVAGVLNGVTRSGRAVATVCPGCDDGAMFREATIEDLSSLRDLERVANLVGLSHVFPPERHPFPDGDVLARWALVLDEPGVDVLVQDSGAGGIDLFAAYDDRSLRHLAVHPDRWGDGLASTAIETVIRAMARRGTTVAELWCLEENRRARRLYEFLGWRPTTDRQRAPWPPHPTEMRYTRLIPQPGR